MRGVCVFGAGSIGCYVGGRLAAAGVPVTLVGRDSMRRVTAGGMRLQAIDGSQVEADPRFETDPAAAAGCNLVLVTVKSGANREAADALRDVLDADAVVVSLQNGLHGGAGLRSDLPDHTVLAGTVGFNVVRDGATFRQATAGDILVQADPVWTGYDAAFARAGLPIEQRTDMPAVQRAKLLLNLNNAINALSGLPLREELAQRAFRRCLSLAQREALTVMAASGPAPAKLTALSPALMARTLAVPDALFRAVAGQVLAIDPTAGSSMADDLAAGRPTEVDWINGAVVQLAADAGTTAPVNARLVELVHDAERGRRPRWTGRDLLAQLRAARR
ncbi:2-dehydropantoate 2-reductase [Flexivirga sp. ID2601S]|uniref:2-dehydropantoate 2-reductase n=1 Tax=Flexivirga aerilata TaxID=1656889 RepID=A0A849AME9_9MICO|nr:2-dehydropantoate 2-reductase [Flexivirga aerilata]NNG40541.1 2-dehydropantoate 2-reductase [Flexivirga aerilata]